MVVYVAVCERLPSGQRQLGLGTPPWCSGPSCTVEVSSVLFYVSAHLHFRFAGTRT